VCCAATHFKARTEQQLIFPFATAAVVTNDIVKRVFIINKRRSIPHVLLILCGNSYSYSFLDDAVKTRAAERAPRFVFSPRAYAGDAEAVRAAVQRRSLCWRLQADAARLCWFHLQRMVGPLFES
jgi:hypothetical protein